MGFSGTPVFLIGPFLIASPLDLPGFQQVVSDARKGKKSPKARSASTSAHAPPGPREGIHASAPGASARPRLRNSASGDGARPRKPL